MCLRKFLFVACSMFLCAAAVPAQDAPPPKLVGSIPLPGVEGRIDHFAIDLQHQVVFVATLGSNSVQAVSLAQKRVIGTITGLTEPQGVVYVPANGRLYVANGGDGTVRIYDAKGLWDADAKGLGDASRTGGVSTLKLIKSVAMGDDADNLRYGEAGSTVWVGYGSGAIASLDLDGNKLKEAQLGAHPEAFAIEKSGSKIYVNVPHKQEVAVIDRNSMSVVATYATGSATGNYPMVLDEKDGRIFVGCRTPATLLVLNSGDGKIIAKLDTVGNTDDLFYDAELHRIYVLGGGGSLVVYDQQGPDSYREVSRIGTGPGGRTGLFVPEMDELLLALPHSGQQQAAIQVYKTR